MTFFRGRGERAGLVQHPGCARTRMVRVCGALDHLGLHWCAAEYPGLVRREHHGFDDARLRASSVMGCMRRSCDSRARSCPQNVHNHYLSVRGSRHRSDRRSRARSSCFGSVRALRVCAWPWCVESGSDVGRVSGVSGSRFARRCRADRWPSLSSALQSLSRGRMRHASGCIRRVPTWQQRRGFPLHNTSVYSHLRRLQGSARLEAINARAMHSFESSTCIEKPEQILGKSSCDPCDPRSLPPVFPFLGCRRRPQCAQ